MQSKVLCDLEQVASGQDLNCNSPFLIKVNLKSNSTNLYSKLSEGFQINRFINFRNGILISTLIFQDLCISNYDLTQTLTNYTGIVGVFVSILYFYDINSYTITFIILNCSLSLAGIFELEEGFKNTFLNFKKLEESYDEAQKLF